MAKEEKKVEVVPSIAADDSPPVRISGEPADVDPHRKPNATKEWAGAYELTHGSVRINDSFYGPGAVLNLGANDGQRFTEAGIAKRVEA